VATDELAPSVRLSRYTIGGVLGRGAFGITYRAFDTLLGREVALKEFLPVDMARREDASQVVATTGQQGRFEKARRDFLEEARTLAALDGVPGIVRVLDFLEANGTAYMVMPLLHGRTLETELQELGTIPERRLRSVALPLLEGLSRVHAAGFLHRDIKPANIILSIEAGPTLLDFGAARAQLAKGSELTRIYTPGYAPIEQLTGGPQGPWTDIYALGATLYECMTGVRPPSAVDRLAGSARVEFTDELRGTYGRMFIEHVQRALAIKPEDRPRSIDDWQLLNDSGSAAASSSAPTVEMPTRGPEAARGWALAKRRKQAIYAGLAIGLTGVAVAWLELPQRIQSDPGQLDGPLPPQPTFAPRTPQQIEAELELTPYDIERVQAGLTAQGFGVGGFDGNWTSDTRAMIAAWQNREGVAPTGYLDRGQYEQLLRQSAEAVAKYDEEQRRGKGDR